MNYSVDTDQLQAISRMLEDTAEALSLLERKRLPLALDMLHDSMILREAGCSELQTALNQVLVQLSREQVDIDYYGTSLHRIADLYDEAEDDASSGCRKMVSDSGKRLVASTVIRHHKPLPVHSVPRFTSDLFDPKIEYLIKQLFKGIMRPL